MAGGLVGAILFGAIAGGVAWGVFTIIPDTWRAARGPITIVAAVLGALNGFTKPLPFQASPAVVERQLLADETIGPMAAAFKQRDPDGFADFVSSMRAVATRGEGRAQAIDRARNAIMQAADARLTLLSDEDLVALVVLSRDEMLEIKNARPDLCHPLFHGRELRTSGFGLSPALTRRKMKLLESAFLAEPGQASAPLEGEALLNAMSDFIARLDVALGDDARLLEPNALIEDDARFCAAAAEYFNQIALSPGAARLQRALWSPGSISDAAAKAAAAPLGEPAASP